MQCVRGLFVGSGSRHNALMKILPVTLAASLALTLPAAAQDEPKGAPSPGEIVAAAPTNDWVAIAPSDLLVMTLAPDRDGNKRQVTIQLMPPPFSQGWVGNIRKLAAAHWWDGLSINRVQDNYVVQWGDPDGEDKAKAKPLPTGIRSISERDYLAAMPRMRGGLEGAFRTTTDMMDADGVPGASELSTKAEELAAATRKRFRADPYAESHVLAEGWPFAVNWAQGQAWPVHCYGMVGVGRDLSPDTGSGAELYTVIGHAPRHLDRNIALVGRVVEGVEHLSSLPRGTGALGFYEKAEQRVPIQSIRLASELPAVKQPMFQYLSTESETFARYADARANRRDPFFIVPAGGADICNVPVPVRRAPAAK